MEAEAKGGLVRTCRASPGPGGSAGIMPIDGRGRAYVERSVQGGVWGTHLKGQESRTPGGLMPTGESDAAVTAMVQARGRKKEDSRMVWRWSRGGRPGLFCCSFSHNIQKLSDRMVIAGPCVVMFLEVRLFSFLKIFFPESLAFINVNFSGAIPSESS